MVKKLLLEEPVSAPGARNVSDSAPTASDSDRSSSDSAPTLSPLTKQLDYPATVNRKRIVWLYAVTIVVVHILALLAFVPWFFSWEGLALALIGIQFYGLAITLGYHRLLAHRSLKVPKWFEHTIVVLAQCSLQDTPAKWVANHRLHHAESDRQPDPHSPMVNFFWSHVEWLGYFNSATRGIDILYKYARDILADPFYMKLEKTMIGPMIYFIHAMIYPAVGALYAWLRGFDAMGIVQMSASFFVWGVLVRTIGGWHVTWSVNSLTHMFGYRTYATTDNSRNNWLVALVALGEGWHNNHHGDQKSASVWHKWWEFDLTYCVILLLKKVGIARDVVPPRFMGER